MYEEQENQDKLLRANQDIVNANWKKTKQGCQPPTLVEVLGDTAPAPYTLNDFQLHMASEYSEHHLEFYKKVERWKRDGTHTDVLSEHQFLSAEMLINQYIREEEHVPGGSVFGVGESSLDTINISADLRSKVIVDFDKCVESRIVPNTLFDEVWKEVFHVINSDGFKRFLKSKTYTNLSTKQRRVYLMIAFTAFPTFWIMPMMIACWIVFSKGNAGLTTLHWSFLSSFGDWWKWWGYLQYWYFGV
ncbi:MAG: regulator of G-protein signaling domain-containing protein [Promethearchaeota archaeon]